MSVEEAPVATLFAVKCALDHVEHPSTIHITAKQIDERGGFYEVTAEPEEQAPKTMHAFIAALATREALLENDLHQDILLVSDTKLSDHAQAFVTAAGLDEILELPNTHLAEFVWPTAA